MDDKVTQIKEQFGLLMAEMGKLKKDISPTEALLGFIVALLFVLIETVGEKK